MTCPVPMAESSRRRQPDIIRFLIICQLMIWLFRWPPCRTRASFHAQGETG